MTNNKIDLGSCVRVTCLNHDALRNHDGRMSMLTAIPVWRATWWLRIGGVVLLASALGAAHTWRVRALKAQQRQLDVLVGERTSALQAALETRDVFLQTLAHDLKAPVASVAWHAQLMRRRVREGRLDSSSLDEGLRSIGIGASEAVAAIDELHDLTRLAAGASLPLRREPVDLVALARRTVNARVESSGRRLHFESGEEKLIVDGIRRAWRACSTTCWTMPQSTVRRINQGWSVLNARMLRASRGLWCACKIMAWGFLVRICLVSSSATIAGRTWH